MFIQHRHVLWALLSVFFHALCDLFVRFDELVVLLPLQSGKLLSLA